MQQLFIFIQTTRFFIGLSLFKAMRISSCFFSSRLKIRISEISEFKKCFRTAFPNEPVPPVINNFISFSDQLNLV